MNAPLIIRARNPHLAGRPAALYHLYLDAVNGDDTNKGFGNDDPSDPDNWADSLATLDVAFAKIPKYGTTILHTQGDLEATGEWFPYLGYINGQVWMISYDDMEDVGEGTIASINPTNDDIRWGRMTVNWTTAPPSVDDATLRSCHALIEEDLGDGKLHNHKIMEYQTGSSEIRTEYHSLHTKVGVGAEIKLRRPSARITFKASSSERWYGWWLNIYFVGYVVNVDPGTGRLYQQWGGEGFSGMAYCHYEGDRGLPSVYQTQDVGLVEYSSRTPHLYGMSKYLKEAQELGLYAGNYMTGTASWNRLDINQQQEVYIRGLVLDGKALFGAGGRGVCFSLRVVEGLAASWTNLQDATRLTFFDCKLSTLHAYPGCHVYFGYGVGFHTEGVNLESYAGAETRMLLEEGCVVDGHAGTAVFIEGPDADLIPFVLEGTRTNEIRFVGEAELATPTSALPFGIIDGGSFRHLRFDLGSMDRGDGEIVCIRRSADVVLEEAHGTNTNAGTSSVGIFVDEESFVGADESECNMSGAAGEVKVGTRDPTSFPVAGAQIIDVEKEDTEPGSDTIVLGATSKAVTFATPFPTGVTPKIELQPLGDAGGALWPTAITHLGFTANISGILGVDLDFDYRAVYKRTQTPSLAMFKSY